MNGSNEQRLAAFTGTTVVGPVVPPAVGAVIAGRYRVEGLLGSGGMGLVVCATHLGLGEHVAIKFLFRDQAERREVVDRFLREAWAAAKIKSDYGVRIHDVATLDDGTPYIVMEHLVGESLESRLAHGPVPVAWAIDHLLQAAEALAEAHKLGIVHRDLKPGNLFLSRRADGTERIKVLDFGISKVRDGSGMTVTNSVLGTPAYMAPEQIRSPRDVDERSDVWALGAVLYEMVTGVRPFEAESLPQAYLAVVEDTPRSFAEVAPGLPRALEAIVLRCLEKVPDRRFSDLRELAMALAPFGGWAAQSSTETIIRLLGPASGTAPGDAPPVRVGAIGVCEEASTIDSDDRMLASGIEATRGERPVEGTRRERPVDVVALSGDGGPRESVPAAISEGPITAPLQRADPKQVTPTQAPAPAEAGPPASRATAVVLPVDTTRAVTSTLDRATRPASGTLRFVAIGAALAATAIGAGLLTLHSLAGADGSPAAEAAPPPEEPTAHAAPPSADPTPSSVEPLPVAEPAPPPASSAPVQPKQTLRPTPAAAPTPSASALPAPAKPAPTADDPWKAMTRDR